MTSRRLALWKLERRLRGLEVDSDGWSVLQEDVSRIGGNLGFEMRAMFYPQTLRRCGTGLIVFPGAYMAYGANIELGRRVAINRNVYITALANVVIGDDVLVGPHTIFNSGSHIYADIERPIIEQGHTRAPIHVADDVWIGAQVVVLPGVTIGAGAVVAAGAVVSKSVEPYTVVGGVPARPIKPRTGASESCDT